MGFCVLHYDKQTGSSSGLSQHIERGCFRDGHWVEWNPTNADKSRTHLNRELIPGSLSRDERISRRIHDAGISNPRKNQVRALTMIMSASCEDMQRLMDEGKLEEWCETSVRWAQRMHGRENVVSAVLHMDEKTPHLHVTVIPIVQGKSKDQAYREKKEKDAEANGVTPGKKRKYKKKDPNALRLCAADVMARTRLKEYQTSYAEAMEKYGLDRGIEGSTAKHVDINDWYKKLVTEVQATQAELTELQSQRDNLSQSVQAVKNTAKGIGDAISSIGKGIGDGLKEMGTYALPSKAREREKAALEEAASARREAASARDKQEQAEAVKERMKEQRDMAIREKLDFVKRHQEEIESISKLKVALDQSETKREHLQGLLDDAAEIGLSALQTLELAKGQEVSLNSITLRGETKPIMPADGVDFRLILHHRLMIWTQQKLVEVRLWVQSTRRKLKDWIRTQEPKQEAQALFKGLRR